MSEETPLCLVVVDKPSTERLVCRHLGFLHNFNIVFDYFGCVMDCRIGCVPFYKHEDGWYMHGRPSNFECMMLSDFEIPKDTYLSHCGENGVAERAFRNDAFAVDDVDDVEKIVFFVTEPIYEDGCCAEDVLAARKYLEVTGLSMDLCECVRTIDFSDECLIDAIQHLQLFKDIYDETCKYLVDHGFPYREPYANGFQRIERLSGMSLKSFCEYFHVKRRTAENWMYGVSPCPDYVLELFEYKLLHEGII